ncbi:Mor transcription activator family protein [Comamonas aquatilis]|uniref:Mor transcription activator family protein n=1 Tax=Comamonas aquatilis TaxID=1778406 RepID=UPI0039EFB999
MNQAITVPIDLLPPLLQEFERLVGLQATMALVQKWGGLRVYFPTPERVTEDHPYAAVIGMDALFKLAEEYGGLPHFQLPKAERALQAVRNARIAAEYATNKTAREIAAEYGLTEGQVVRIVAMLGVSAPPDRRQRALF